MNEVTTSTNSSPRGRKKAAAAPKEPTTIRWEGRELPLRKERGIWRLRCKSKSFNVNFSTGTASLQDAKRIAREKLTSLPVKKERCRNTLEDAVEVYLGLKVRRCGQDAAEGNVARLRSLVRTAFEDDTKTLDSVKLDELQTLWPLYVEKRGGSYSKPLRVNAGIISAIKQSASLFIKALRPAYKAAGMEIPADATTIVWPLAPTITKQEAKDADLVAAWKELKDGQTNLWIAIGLARFAGLRQSEIVACRGKWIVAQGAAVYVDLRNREEDGFFTKTGKFYKALILDPDLAAYLQGIEKESPVISEANLERWIQREPQNWLKTGGFIGDEKPLHRLRGLYADQMRREHEIAIMARQEALAIASKALGHTTTATTTKHYTEDDGKDIRPVS